MQKLQMPIKRRYLDEILEGTKTDEFREVKPYWTKRLGKLELPFILGLRAGYSESSAYIEVECTDLSVIDYHDDNDKYIVSDYKLKLGKVIMAANL